ncbi:hypothetical protein ACFLSA_05255 [Bacteroidota bacterium]
MYKPGKPEHIKGGTYPPFPDGDISFLQEIPAIGTTFKEAEDLGPVSQKEIYRGFQVDNANRIKIWFDFHLN